MSAYLRIARPDHWIKNVLVLPGMLFGWLLGGEMPSVAEVFAAALSVCAIVSANYTLNEYLDREFDRFHPVKRHRAGARGELRAGLVALQYLLLATAGLVLAGWLNTGFLLTSVALLVNTISAGEAAPMKRATRSRAPSNAAVARSLSS